MLNEVALPQITWTESEPLLFMQKFYESLLYPRYHLGVGVTRVNKSIHVLYLLEVEIQKLDFSVFTVLMLESRC